MCAHIAKSTAPCGTGCDQHLSAIGTRPCCCGVQIACQIGLCREKDLPRSRAAGVGNKPGRVLALVQNLMAAPGTPVSKIRKEDESTSSSSPVLGHGTDYSYFYSSGEEIRGGDVVTYRGNLASVLHGNGGRNKANPQVTIQIQATGSVSNPTCRSLVFVRRPSTHLRLPEAVVKEEEEDDGSLPALPSAAVMPAQSASPAVKSPSAEEDADFLATFSRLNLQDKELIKDMVHRLARNASVLPPPNPPSEVPAEPKQVRPKPPGIEQLPK